MKLHELSALEIVRAIVSHAHHEHSGVQRTERPAGGRQVIAAAGADRLLYAATRWMHARLA
jgi:glyoxylase-like metal-dependent hydrolase (beta-lactamase superfamily II)